MTDTVRRGGAVRAAAVILAIAAAAALAPRPAFASIISSIADAFKDGTQEILAARMNTTADWLDDITGGLTGWAAADIDMEGDTLDSAEIVSVDDTRPASGVINFVAKNYGIFKPLAATILATVTLIQILRELQKPDNGPGNIPYVERFGWILFRTAIIFTAVKYAIPITATVYNVIAAATNTINSVSIGNYTPADIARNSDDIAASIINAAAGKDQPTPGGLLISVGESLLSGLLVMAVCGIANVAVSARWIQVYVMILFAPVMFAFAGLDETRQMTINYIKSVASAALAMLITVIVVKAMAMTMCNALLSAPTMFNIFCTTLLYIYAISQCGKWASAIIG